MPKATNHPQADAAGESSNFLQLRGRRVQRLPAATKRRAPLARAPAPDIAKTHESIIFQVIDVLGYNDPATGAPEVHLFGVTELGNSVLVRIRHFEHYFYVPKPERFVEDDLVPLREHLNTKLGSSCISEITLQDCTFATTRKETGKPWPTGPFIKISLANHRDIQRASQIFKTGQCFYKDLFDPALKQTYGSGIPYNLRFTLDHEIDAMAWLKLANEEYHVIPQSNKISYCQLEVWARQEQLVVCDSAEYANKQAPLRILSFDIETLIPPPPPICYEKLPNPTREKVIQIGNMVSMYDGITVNPSFVKKIFTLDSCDAIEGVEISSFDHEKDMLSAWRDFFVSVDADLVLGYNHASFDIPFLLKRAIVLGIEGFACMGRIRGMPQILPPPQNKVEYNTCPGYDGRVLVDLWYHFKTRFGGELESFSLNSVASRFIQAKKEDIHFTQIPVLQAGNSETRRKLAIYCLKDVELPLNLLNNMKCFKHDVQLARQSGVSLHDMRVIPWHRKMFAVRWKGHQCILVD